MVWWWSDSKSKDVGMKLEKTMPAPVADHQISTPLAPARPTLIRPSREEQAMLDFEELMKEFKNEQDVQSDARLEAKTFPTPNAPLAPSDISQDTLYPTEMFCRSAFDYAMFCQSFGGQFVNVYRYGEFRSCSNHWEDFWLCMRTRNWEDKDKRKAIHDRYKEKAIKWKTGPSSEDIWEVRQDPVKDPFQRNLDELEAKIWEWKTQNPDAPDPWLAAQGATFRKPTFQSTK